MKKPTKNNRPAATSASAKAAAGRPKKVQRRAPVPVAGVGASAGGLTAFTQLLRGLPPNPGMALVFVQHLSPTYESALPELLSKETHLPVSQATNRTQIAINHVYVVPPNAELTVVDGILRLGARPQDKTQYNPIDAFFRSLATWAEGRAFGVLLSGTSSDGVAGLREIRAAGGTALVQEPESTEFPVMPRAAIAAGVADLVQAPEQIATSLARLVAHPLLAERERTQVAPESLFSEIQMRRIFTLLRWATAVDFSRYKEPTIRRRLQRRMLLQKVADANHYIKLLEEKPAEVQSLYQDLLIQVTRFFREPESYVALTSKVFPRLTEDRPQEGGFRIWIPGCATGEEAYSVAIVLLEFLGDQANQVPIQIFATDVSDRAIERARAGLYPETISEDVSPQRLRRFFSKLDGNFQISKAVRDLCVFAHQDLTRDPPFSKLDLIVCRNVLIYLDPGVHKKLMSLFHYALKPNGFLMLGRAESTGSYGDYFQTIEKKHRIFLRKPSAARTDLEFHPVDPTALKAPPSRRPSQPAREGNGFQSEATRILVSRFAPPGVIVDSDLRIVQTRGQTSAFLELSPGEPNLNLFKMLREGLLFGAREALNQARKTGQAARKEGIKLRLNGERQTVDIEVIPLAAAPAGERHYLVLFEPSAAGRSAAAEPAHRPSARAAGSLARQKNRGRQLDDTRVLELRQELAASREYLQSIIQDLEATNEELQSANEEILSSNEELQSTNEELDTAKEELQSTNEEINTVNEELQSRNEEMSRANGDLVNLLAGVQIAIVFVTSDLRIRRFTPMAEKALNLIASDVGRPIGNIRPNIDCPDLETLIKEAVDNVIVKEREVQDRDGNWLLLRIRPYKSLDNRIDGAVLVLLDIDALRKHEQRSQQAQDLAGAILDSVERPMMVLDAEMHVVAANRLLTQLLRRDHPEVVGKPLAALVNADWNIAELKDRIAKIRPGDRPLDLFDVPRAIDGSESQKVVLRARKFDGGMRRSPLALLSLEEPPRA
ncbi:MAG TPA: CheR family methyltransferase [Polyangia bacterium]|jgi:two-component system CheB/CheR fusion protein|nr:CheR family methyltransferase [Polyangia bacterium]